VAEALGNRRLLTVGVRDPAPPLFGPGFGIKESAPGVPSFRWAGPSARLIVPGLDGPPAAFLTGERPAHGGPATLTVTDPVSGRVVTTRVVAPGPFDLAIVDLPVYGPLERPRQYVLSCDRPVPLPPMEGGLRPKEGCFVFRESTFSAPREKLWEKLGEEYRVDVGTRDDFRAALEGFYGRETVPGTGVDFRWTDGRASLVWVPRPGFQPRQVAVRAMTPGKSVAVDLSIDGRPAGRLTFSGSGFSEERLDLDPTSMAALAGIDPVRIGLSSPAVSPKPSGTDTRELGIAVDRVLLR
jgi:hypothetical protein